MANKLYYVSNVSGLILSYLEEYEKFSFGPGKKIVFPNRGWYGYLKVGLWRV